MTKFAYLTTPQSTAMEPLAASCQTISQQPICVDLEIYEGDDFYLDLEVTNPDDTPADLTGVVAQAQIRTSAQSESVLAEFTYSISGNIIHLHLPNTANVDMPDSAVWDCQISRGQDNSSTWNWSTDNTGAPNAGDIGLTQAVWDADDLFVNLTDADGTNRAIMLGAVQPGAQIRVELVSDTSRFASYTVTADSVVVVGYREFPIAVNNSAGAVPSAGDLTRLRLPSTSTDITTLVAGSVKFTQEVTRPT